MAASYKPSATRTSDDTIATFITAEVEETLTQVPGVGPANERVFNGVGITTTFQLLGKFLSFRGAGQSVPEVCDQFYAWLKEIGVNSSRASIIKALAEKLNTWIPGFYDEAAFTE